MLNHLQKLGMNKLGIATAALAFALLTACGGSTTPTSPDGRPIPQAGGQLPAVSDRNDAVARDAGRALAMRTMELATAQTNARTENAEVTAARGEVNTARSAYLANPSTANQNRLTAAQNELSSEETDLQTAMDAVELAQTAQMTAAATASDARTVRYNTWETWSGLDTATDSNLVRGEALTINLHDCLAKFENRFMRGLANDDNPATTLCVDMQDSRPIPIDRARAYHHQGVSFEEAGMNAAGAVGGFTFGNAFMDKDPQCCTLLWRQSQSSRNYFAGLHSDTNVGERLTQNTGTARWKGRFYARADGLLSGQAGAPASVRDTDTAFTMQIDYGQRMIQANIPQNGDSGGYDIRGGYNEVGYIDAGIHNYGDDRVGHGHVRGVIGKAGLAAVFISRNDTRPAFGQSDNFSSGARYYGYSGGFVACPTANDDGTGACQAHQ